jgi:hypothetical protein
LGGGGGGRRGWWGGCAGGVGEEGEGVSSEEADFGSAVDVWKENRGPMIQGGDGYQICSSWCLVEAEISSRLKRSS